MKIGIREDCRSCSQPIALCQIRSGIHPYWVPFELAMVERTDGIADAYLPVRRARSVALVPVEEISEHRLASVRWVAVRHRCAEYLRSKAAAYRGYLAKREHVASLGDSLESVLGPLLDQDADHQSRLTSGETT